jgi:hypothetical protein
MPRSVRLIGCLALLLTGAVIGRLLAVPETWAAGATQRAPIHQPAPPARAADESRQMVVTLEQKVAGLERKVADLERGLKDHVARYGQHTHEVSVPNVGYMTMQAGRALMESGANNPSQGFAIVGTPLNHSKRTSPPE